MTAERTGTGRSPADIGSWSVASTLMVLGVIGFYYFADQALLYRVLGLLAMFALAAVIVAGTSQGLRLRGFIKEARSEVRKMVWATRAETLQTSLVVFVSVILMALFLWLLDRLLSWSIGGILS